MQKTIFLLGSTQMMHDNKVFKTYLFRVPIFVKQSYISRITLHLLLCHQRQTFTLKLNVLRGCRSKIDRKYANASALLKGINVTGNAKKTQRKCGFETYNSNSVLIP